MRVVEDEFRLGYHGWEPVKDSYERICQTWLAEKFNIPEGTGMIWLSLYTEPAKERYRVLVEADEDLMGAVSVLFDGEIYGRDDLDEVLRPYIGKWLYLECKYEA